MQNQSEIGVGYRMARTITINSSERQTYEATEEIRFRKLYKFVHLESRRVFVGKIFDRKKARLPEQELRDTDSARCLYIHAVHKQMQLIQGVNRLHCVLEDDHYFAMLFLYLPNGSLFDLKKRRIKLTEVEVRCYAHQILQTVLALEDKCIVHRNLQLKHFVFDEAGQLHLVDFAEAKHLFSQYTVTWTPRGPLRSRPPEMLDQSSYQQFNVNSWQVGCLLWEMATGTSAFRADGDFEQDIKKKIQKGGGELAFPQRMSPELKNLIC
jgi:serine/threonine protein kinase